MKNQKQLSKEKLMSVKEAATLLDVSVPTVQSIAKKMGWEQYKVGVKMYKKLDVAIGAALRKNICNFESPYGNMSLMSDESLRLLDSINSPRGFLNPKRYRTSCKYAVSNRGRVFNIKHNHILDPSYDTNGYAQIRLQKGQYGTLVNVHRLVAYLWCDNGKFKLEVHHIDGNRKNNNKDNLIFVTKSEHCKLHKLMESGKLTGNMKEYDEYIQAIYEDNKVTENMKMIVTQDATGFHHYIYVRENLYMDIKSGKRLFSDVGYNEILADILDEDEINETRRIYECAFCDEGLKE